MKSIFTIGLFLVLTFFVSCNSKPKVEAQTVVKSHIHTVVRTPNGNDYGKDLLKEHLEKHHRGSKN